MNELDPMSWTWISDVILIGFFVTGTSGALLLPLARFADSGGLDRLPNWLRWVLILPFAFVASLLVDSLSNILLAILEALVNYRFLFSPGVKMLIWQWWEPLVFVACGSQMAPRKYQVHMYFTLACFKAVVAATNLYVAIHFIMDGGFWTATGPIVESPVWWNCIVYLIFILTLLVLGVGILRQPRINRDIAAKALKSYEQMSRDIDDRTK